MIAVLKQLTSAAADGASYLEMLLVVLFGGIVVAIVVPLIQH